jgi:hypothetical protein
MLNYRMLNLYLFIELFTEFTIKVIYTLDIFVYEKTIMAHPI